MSKVWRKRTRSKVSNVVKVKRDEEWKIIRRYNHAIFGCYRVTNLVYYRTYECETFHSILFSQILGKMIFYAFWFLIRGMLTLDEYSTVILRQNLSQIWKFLAWEMMKNRLSLWISRFSKQHNLVTTLLDVDSFYCDKHYCVTHRHFI